MLVDTGAAVSIIPQDMYSTDLQHVPLKRAEVALRAYGGGRLEVAGVLATGVETEEGNKGLVGLVGSWLVCRLVG